MRLGAILALAALLGLGVFLTATRQTGLSANLQAGVFTEDYTTARSASEVALQLLQGLKIPLNSTELKTFKEVANPLPANGAMKKFNFPLEQLEKALPILAKTFLTPIPDAEVKRFLEMVHKCAKKGVTHRADTSALSTNNKKGFSFAIQYLIAYCGNPGKAEILVHHATHAGQYTKVEKIVTENVCKKSPITGIEICKEVSKLVQVDRDVTPEMMSIVERGVFKGLHDSFKDALSSPLN